MTSIDQLAAEINRQLALYANQTSDTVERVAEKVAREGAEELKMNSPKKTGDYAEGWTVKRVGNTFVVHNRIHYRLTHLIEKGYAKRNGGRKDGRPHIAPVEDRMITDFEQELRQELSE